MTSNLPKRSSVVGTIHSPAALDAARLLKAGEIDFLEVRVDHFVDDLPVCWRQSKIWLLPLIITVRHLQEGGAAPLSFSRRADLYREFFPFAALIDVELRSAGPLSSVLQEAREREDRPNSFVARLQEDPASQRSAASMEESARICAGDHQIRDSNPYIERFSPACLSFRPALLEGRR
jgi:hypothetical protein